MIVREGYYAVLQVDPVADPDVIESAYHRLARKYHPDVNRAPEATERMRAINQAYYTLSNPGRRAIYDRQWRGPAVAQRLQRNNMQRASSSSFGPRATISTSLQRFEAATAPLKARAASSFASWASAWSEALEAIVAGDGLARERASRAGGRCLAALTDCLAQWEAQVPPPTASRLGHLGAACLRLQVALVRGTLSFTDGADVTVLLPLAGLAERIHGLTRTIAAEALLLSRAADWAQAAPEDSAPS